jgi:hypothetical protein
MTQDALAQELRDDSRHQEREDDGRHAHRKPSTGAGVGK